MSLLEDDNNKKMKACKMSSVLHQHNHQDLKQQQHQVNYDDSSNKYQLLEDYTRHHRVSSEKKKTSCNNHIVRPFKLFLIFLQITCQILIIINVVVHLSNYNSFTVNAHLLSPKAKSHADRRFGFGGAGASVDIALEKVPEKTSDSQYGYGGQAKKKFPITWLRNQYPFNKKKKSKYSHVNQHHQQQEQLYGQYSNQQFDVLDPNPSTWVKLTPPTSNNNPTKPIAQQPFFIQTPVSQQVSHLQPFHIANLPLAPQSAAVANLRYPLGPTNDVMQFSSSDQIIQQQYNNQFAVPSAAPIGGGARPPQPAPPAVTNGPRGRPRGPGAKGDPGKGADSAAGGDGYGSGGFGGVSLQFGNGRSISFGGGQGLTIGTKAGAISIGGKGGGSEGGGETLASQGSHSDGYPSGGRTISIGSGRGITIGGYESSGDSGGKYGNSGASSYGGDNSSSGYGNNKYYKKNYKPTMSVEMPKKGKTVIHGKYMFRWPVFGYMLRVLIYAIT